MVTNVLRLRCATDHEEVPVPHYEAAVSIDAAPERVWEVLLDAPAYPSWDSGVTRVEGTIADGHKITVHAAVSPGRAFPVRVAVDRGAGTMTWRGGLPLGLFTGVRSFRLVPSAGGTSFTVQEDFSGPLVGLIARKMPDLGPSFTQSANGLKARAER
jgi:hypothetical protein